MGILDGNNNSQPWSENLPGGTPNPGNASQLPLLLQLMMKLPGGGLGPKPMMGGSGSPARPGALLPPTAPGQIPGGPSQGGGMPGGGMGSTGGASMVPSQHQFVSSAPRPVPYVSQNGFLTSGARKEGLIADSIASIFNMVGDKKQKNEQKQFLEAENTWNQLLSAQQALQQNPNDQQAHAIVDSILSDKKRMKQVEESLQMFLPKEPGGEEQTPATAGAQSAVKKFFSKFGNMTKTQAQQMPPQQGPGPKPNTPGGYMWSFPQMNPMQQAQQALLQDPKVAQDAAKKSLGIPTDEELALNNAKISQLQSEVEKNGAIAKIQPEIADTRQKIAQADLIKAQAYAKWAHAKASGQGATSFDPKVVSSYATKVANHEITLGQVPEKGGLRNSVVSSLAGVPIMQKFNNSQQSAWDSLPTTENMINTSEKILDQYFKAHPEAISDEGIQGWINAGKSYNNFLRYQLHLRPDDPAVSEMIKNAAYLKIQGAKAFTTVGRGKYQYEVIKQHLPSPDDSPALMKDKISWLKNMVEEQRNALWDYRWGGKVEGISGVQQKMEGEKGPQAPPPSSDLNYDPATGEIK